MRMRARMPFWLFLLLLLSPQLLIAEETAEGSGEFIEDVDDPEEHGIEDSGESDSDIMSILALGDTNSEPDRGDQAGEHSDEYYNHYEGSGDYSTNEDCWDYLGTCHPDSRASVDGRDCVHCSTKEHPEKWEQTDVKLNLGTCEPDLAIMNFDLSNLLDLANPWIDDTWTVELSYKFSEEGAEKKESVKVDDLRASSTELRGLCSGNTYSICLEIRKDGQIGTNGNLCQTCSPSGPPPHNPTEISVVGDATYMDVRWSAVEMQCPDLRYDIMVNGSVKDTTDQTQKWVWDHAYNKTISRLDPGIHTVTVRARNSEGTSEGELTYATFQTFSVKPPIVMDTETSVVNGELVTTITWSPPLEEDPVEITKKGYYLTLYNMSSLEKGWPADDHVETIEIDETSYSVNLSSAEGWMTEFSLQTFLGESVSDKTPQQRLFKDLNIQGAPRSVIVQPEIADGVLTSHVNWQYEGEGFEGLKTLVHLRNSEGQLIETREVEWPQVSVELELSPALPWVTNVSLQTAVLEAAMEETEEMEVFGGMKLTPPIEGSVRVENTVREGKVVADISWENSMSQVFEGLETILEVRDKKSYLTEVKRVAYPASRASIRLEEVESWECEVSLHTEAVLGRGEAIAALPLFSNIPLSKPADVEVVTGVQDGVLTATVSWNNTMFGGAKLTEFSTQATLLDNMNNIVDAVTVEYPNYEFSYKLSKELPWDVRFTLATTGKEIEGQKTEAQALFPLTLAKPQNVSLYHTTDGAVLMANIAWEHGLDTEAFRDQITMVKLYTEEGTLMDIPKQVPYDQTSYSLGHLNPAFGEQASVKWGAQYSLSSCVEAKITRCGPETEKQRLFPSSLLTPPKNIDVTYEYDTSAHSLFAEITWENSIEEPFQGLVTVLNTWIQESEGTRRKRQVERKIKEEYFQFSSTSRQIYYADMDKSTMFSLQTAMENTSSKVMGEESEARRLFPDSALGPPADISSEVAPLSGTLTSQITWTPSSPAVPTHLTIYSTDGQELKSIPVEEGQDNLSITLDADLPLDATFTMTSSYKPNEEMESDLQPLFQFLPSLPSPEGIVSPAPALLPPVITNITVLTPTSARLEWSHQMEPFVLLETVVNLWWGNGSLHSSLPVKWSPESLSEMVVEVEAEEAPGLTVSLQSRVNRLESDHSERMPVFEAKRDFLSWLLMIIALTVLLLLYILATTFCLRRLCNKSGRLDPARQKGSSADPEPGTPGHYSFGARAESKPLMGNGHTQSLPSEAGSDNTDQSLLSDEAGEPLCSTPLPPSLLYPGDSMLTLNKFNEEDDDFFMGGFNEDGSFIGDYMENDPDENRAVMNRLVGFQQLFSRKF